MPPPIKTERDYLRGQISDLKAEIESLKAENLKLRTQSEFPGLVWEQLAAHIHEAVIAGTTYYEVFEQSGEFNWCLYIDGILSFAKTCTSIEDGKEKAERHAKAIFDGLAGVSK